MRGASRPSTRNNPSRGGPRALLGDKAVHKNENRQLLKATASSGRSHEGPST